MKPTQIHPKRTIALLAITALLPLAANAGTLRHVESSHIAAPAASVTKIAALADSDTRYATHKTAFLMAQQNLRASLQALRQGDHGGGIRVG